MPRTIVKFLAIASIAILTASCGQGDASAAAKKELEKFYGDFETLLNSEAFPKDPSPGLVFFDDQTILFEVSEPERYVGEAFKKHFMEIASQSPAKIEISELNITTSSDGKMAFVNFIQRAYGTWHDGTKFDSRWRTTDGLLKKDGKWKIVHEHNSIPLDEKTLLAVMTKGMTPPAPQPAEKPAEQ